MHALAEIDRLRKPPAQGGEAPLTANYTISDTRAFDGSKRVKNLMGR
jgi:hypothetical protein